MMLIERNLFSAVCSSGLLARAMSNGGNPFLEGHIKSGKGREKEVKTPEDGLRGNHHIGGWMEILKLVWKLH